MSRTVSVDIITSSGCHVNGVRLWTFIKIGKILYRIEQEIACYFFCIFLQATNHKKCGERVVNPLLNYGLDNKKKNSSKYIFHSDDFL